MSKFNAVKEAVSRGYLRVGAVVGSAVLALPAMAQTADPFDTAIAEATTKITAYASALVPLSAIAVLFIIAIKYIKKIPRAS